MSVMRIYALLKNPFYSSAHTNIETALSLTIVVIQAGYMLSVGVPEIHSFQVLIFSIIFFLFSYLGVELLNNVNYHNIRIAINSDNVEYLNNVDPQKIFQFIIGKNVGSNLILKKIRKRSKGNFHILMKAMSHKFDGDFEYLIECSNYLLGFVIYRMLNKGNTEEKTEDPSTSFDSDYFWYQMIRGEVNEAMHDIIQQSRKSVFSLQDACKENPLQTNLRKLLKREIPAREKLMFFLIIVFFLTFSVAIIFPLVKLSTNIDNVVNVPRVLRKSMNIGILWSRLLLGIEHSVNCTTLNNVTFDKIIEILYINIPEQSYVVPNVIGDFNRKLSTMAKEVAQEVIQMNTYLDGLVSDSFSRHIDQLWFIPRIPFPLNFGDKQTYMDIRSIMMFYLAEITIYHNADLNTSDRDNWCDTRLTNHFGENMYCFMNSSIELLMAYNSFVDSYQKYIYQNIETYEIVLTKEELIYICVFFLASLLFDAIWNYFSFKRLFDTIHEKYQIHVHPTYTMGYDHEIKSSKMEVSNELFLSFGIGFVTGLIFFVIALILRYESNFYFDTMMKYNMISVRIENLSLTFSIVIHSYFRSYLFNDTDIYNQFQSKITEFEYVLSTLDQAFSPLNLVKFKYEKNLPYIMQYHENNLMFSSFHDIYNSWPLMQLVFLMNSMVTDSPSVYPLDPNSNFFIHLNHINIAHFKPGIDQVHELISQLAEDQSKYLILIISVCIVLFCVYLIFVFFMLYRRFVRINRCYKILSIHILKLDPIFLLEQKNLVDHILCTKQDDLKSINDMKELFTAADVPLILVGRKDTIINYSKPVLKMFGMRDDQLIGHSLLTLIQDDQRRFLNHIHNRIASTFDVKGINSNDELFSVEAKITPLSSYTLLQFKMIDEILDYEELIQVHSDLFIEYMSTSFPTCIVNSMNLIYPDIYQRNFSKFTFLIIATEMPTGENECNVELMKHYFSDCIVLYYNCSLWCSIFVGENPLIEAIVCYQYFGFNDERKAGIILEGTDLSVFFYGLPENYDVVDPREIMSSVPPHVSIEPKMDLMSYFSYINKLVLGKLIARKQISRFFDESHVSSLDNEFVMIENEVVCNAQFFLRSGYS